MGFCGGVEGCGVVGREGGREKGRGRGRGKGLETMEWIGECVVMYVWPRC